ncbi:MAG: 2-C-methyl-D-erythritol 4-phosphate cytidylyltransferase [Gammaproteobacteria bacterium]|nr:2-C-methyl-D-erythritol 4-phosphate cytidylyltransferase [Gammaproteobacteria bacterium]
MTDNPKMWCVVPAAGIGSRMGLEFPKQYLEIAGKPIIQHTIETLLKLTQINGLVVCLAPHDRWFSSLQIDDNRVIVTEGGATRAESVMNGLDRLQDVAHDRDWALVHDAARPCVDPADIEAMIIELENQAVGGVLAIEARDTLKQADIVDGKPFSQTTIDRSKVWHAQTPQMIRYATLRTALKHCIEDGASITDEASALELIGESVMLCKGSVNNIKITTPEDQYLAEYLLTQ